jgi:hypothetical protein
VEADDMRKVFISYHHANDQQYKESLVQLGIRYGVFQDWSVDSGDISDDLGDDIIREKVRDEYLRESTVTIVLVGLNTWGRKHVDWEVYSSMFNGRINKRSGVLVVNLPSINCDYYTAAHGELEKKTIYPENTDWTSIDEKQAYEKRYPYMPERIIDNLLAPKTKISVVNWSKIQSNPQNLSFLVETTHSDRESCEYDLSRPMRRRDA